MKKSKLFLMLIASFILSVSIGTVANAVPHLGGDWTTGIKDPGNGYVMGYSYYYHPTKTHWASVTTNGTTLTSGMYPPGQTAPRNGLSVLKATAKISTNAYILN